MVTRGEPAGVDAVVLIVNIVEQVGVQVVKLKLGCAPAGSPDTEKVTSCPDAPPGVRFAATVADTELPCVTRLLVPLGLPSTRSEKSKTGAKGFTVIESGWVAGGVWTASCTSTVKLAPPWGPSGVPLMTPVEAFRVSPAGSDPLMNPHAYGGMPPVAVNGWLYGTPMVAGGRLAVRICNGGAAVDIT